MFISGDSSLFSLKFQTYHFNAADGMYAYGLLWLLCDI